MEGDQEAGRPGSQLSVCMDNTVSTYMMLTWGAGTSAVVSSCHRHTTECVYTVMPFTGPWSFHASFVIVDIVRTYTMLTFLFSRTIPGDQSLCCHRRQTGPKWATLAGQTYPNSRACTDTYLPVAVRRECVSICYLPELTLGEAPWKVISSETTNHKIIKE